MRPRRAHRVLVLVFGVSEFGVNYFANLFIGFAFFFQFSHTEHLGLTRRTMGAVICFKTRMEAFVIMGLHTAAVTLHSLDGFLVFNGKFVSLPVFTKEGFGIHYGLVPIGDRLQNQRKSQKTKFHSDVLSLYGLKIM